MVDVQTKEKYAELALRKGVNLQKNQALLINAPIETADFTRIVVRKAYELGAKDVHVRWSDDELTRLKYEHASTEVLENYPQWLVDMQESFAQDGGALLSIYSTDPDLLKDIDPSRVALANKAAGQALTKFREQIMNDQITWSLISIPTGKWAEKIFPEHTRKEATERLWEAIIKTVRVDKEDPILEWELHNATLKRAYESLNEKAYEKLIFKAPGTNLEIGLPKGHIWHGGSAISEKGIEFNPNMPTEEVYSVPHKYLVNGTVASTKPLNYGGNIIDNFSLTFKDGKVVDYKAEQGKETLQHLLETDDGAKRLGEVALVPHESPISKSGLLFYNTLFDENASCHIALGKAYPTNIKNGPEMSLKELDEHGVNDSLVHVDFMIGSAELDIDGVKADGTTEPVFRSGAWALQFD